MISVILPAYNEEKNIGRMTDSISDFFKKLGLSYEIIAINDGSRDGTEKVLNECKKTENIVIVSHAKNLGYGAALRSGFAKASGDLIFFTDSDCQFDIKDIKIFLDKIQGYDFIIGYRKNRKDPLIRKIYAEIFRAMCRVFFGIKVKDVDCAFKLYKNYVLADLDLVSNGALINLEILAKAKKKNYKFLELPVQHFERREGRPTGGSFGVIFRAMASFFSLWFKTRI